MTRLYRVEATDLRPKSADTVAGMKRGLGDTFYNKWVAERGRLFADNTGTLSDYGHGAPGMTTYYVDVPKDVAASVKREALVGNNPNEKFNEYLLSPEAVAKRRPLPGAVSPGSRFEMPTNPGGIGGSRPPTVRSTARNFLKDDIGGGRLPFDKNTRYGTPAEVAAANDPRLVAIGSGPEDCSRPRHAAGSTGTR